MRYPDIPLLTTDEVAVYYAGDPRVKGTGISNTEPTEVREGNLARLLVSTTPPDPGEVARRGLPPAASRPSGSLP